MLYLSRTIVRLCTGRLPGSTQARRKG